MKVFTQIILFLILLILPSNAHAYLGPGMGIGAIIAVLGVILSIILALFGIIYYPIKKLKNYIKNKKKKQLNDKE